MCNLKDSLLSQLADFSLLLLFWLNITYYIAVFDDFDKFDGGDGPVSACNHVLLLGEHLSDQDDNKNWSCVHARRIRSTNII